MSLQVARETEGLRKCAERCLQTLADTVECRQQVQQAVLGLCEETAAAGLQVHPLVMYHSMILRGCK